MISRVRAVVSVLSQPLQRSLSLFYKKEAIKKVCILKQYIINITLSSLDIVKTDEDSEEAWINLSLKAIIFILIITGSDAIDLFAWI